MGIAGWVLNLLTGHKDIAENATERGAQSVEHLANQGSQCVNHMADVVQAQGGALQQGAKVFGDNAAKIAKVGGAGVLVAETINLAVKAKEASAKKERAAAATEHAQVMRDNRRSDLIQQNRKRVPQWAAQAYKFFQDLPDQDIMLCFICKDEALLVDLKEDAEVPAACKDALYMEYPAAVQSCIDAGYDRKGLVVLYDLTYSPQSQGWGDVDVTQLHQCILQGSPLGLTRIKKVVFNPAEPCHVYLHKVHLTGKGYIWNPPAPPSINIIDVIKTWKNRIAQAENRAREESETLMQVGRWVPRPNHN